MRIDSGGYHSTPAREQLLRLQRNEPTLTSLTFHLDLSPFEDDTVIPVTEIEELGRNIGSNTHLTKLTFYGGGNRSESIQVDESRTQFQMLCEGANLNQSIKEVNFLAFDLIGSDIIRFLTLENNPNLQTIWLHSSIIKCEGMRLIAAALVQRGSPLVKLGLTYNTIDGDLLAGLIMPLLENPALAPKELDLQGNNIEQNGYNLIAELLQDPMCSIEKLNLGRVYEISLINLANAFARNNTLKELDLPQFSTSANALALGIFSQSLCNTTDINATYSSNHTLSIFRNQLPSDLDQYLEWNTNADKKMVARRKVFMQHFIRDFRMKPFKEMHPDLLGRVLSFMDKASVENGRERNDNARCSILFELVKNSPMVCERVKSATMRDGSARKKRRM